MLTSDELKNSVALYLSDKVDLKSFQQQFALALKDSYRSRDRELKTLVDSIGWQFSDLYRGESSEAALKEKLAELSSVGLSKSMSDTSVSKDTKDAVVLRFYLPGNFGVRLFQGDTKTQQANLNPRLVLSSSSHPETPTLSNVEFQPA